MVKTLKEARALKKSPKWQKMSPYERMEALFGKSDKPKRKPSLDCIRKCREDFRKAGWKNAAKLFYFNYPE